MAIDLGSARLWAGALQRAHIAPGMTAVDATMGNGGDTELLAGLVGEGGHVWAFDVQQGALDKTRARLVDAGLMARVSLVMDGHQHMEAHVPGPVDAIAFNLGWLPGGDKGITTLTSTTLLALDAALRLLNEAGLMTICAYPGHGEGARELGAVSQWAAGLDPARYQARETRYLNQPKSAPVMIAVRRMK